MAQLKWPAAAQDIFSSSSTQLHPLGARGEDIFGRGFRYVQAGVSDLVVGNALQAQAQITQHQDMTPSAAAIGDKLITVTPGATGGAANLYEEGIAVIDTTPGLGYSYPIKGHLAITSSTAFTVNLGEGWAVVVALTAANSKVSLYPNPYKNVIQYPITTATSVCVGVCQYIITGTQYGWIGVRGHFGTLITGTPGVGLEVGVPAAAAGAVAINSSTNMIVGTMMDTGQDGKVEGVFWKLM